MAIMSRDLYNELETNGFAVRDDYSGRCMFGRSCFGYEPNEGNLFLWFLRQLYEEGEDWEFYDEVKNLLDDGALERQCSDSMGLGIIIYYPNLQVAEFDEADDEADDSDIEE